MKLRMLLSLTVAIEIVLLSWAGAQILQPIDPKKMADIDTKPVNLGEAQFQTVPQLTRDQPNAPVSKGNVKFQGYDTKQVDFHTLEMSTIEKPVLPQANFTAKRIAVKMSDETNKKLNHAKEKAPINKREIRPFAPGGEEELKKQLNEPH